MLPIARMLDTTFGVCTGHLIPISVSGMTIPSQFTVIVNGLPVIRMMDTVIGTCGHTGIIMSGSSKVFISGLPTATMSSSFVGTYSGTIINGSSNVFCS